ncbi:MAG: PilN domain-containing protein [Thermodesulfobacteriota bacterium]
MIKINLLPGKEKKKIGVKKELIIFIGSLMILIILLIFVQWKIAKEKQEMISQINKTKDEIAYYKKLNVEVNKAKEAEKILQEKLNVIETLRKEKASPSRILDELSINKPEKLHLESLKKQGNKLDLEGLAIDDETIANFMTNLRKSKFFKTVDLIVSEQVEQSKIKLKKFTLSCEINVM